MLDHFDLDLPKAMPCLGFSVDQKIDEYLQSQLHWD